MKMTKSGLNFKGPISYPYFCFPQLNSPFHNFFFFDPHQRTFFSLLLEREEGRKKERETHQYEKHQLVAFHGGPDRGSDCSLGTCLDRESNPQPFSYRMTLQPTESHGPGRVSIINTPKGKKGPNRDYLSDSIHSGK